MRAKHPETQQLIIPVAGAGNVGFNVLSTAQVHMHPLRKALGHLAGRYVTSPVIPDTLGIGNLESAALTFRDKVHGMAEQHPNAKIVIVGHSFGGMLGKRLAYEEPDLVTGVVTLGSPHNGIRTFLPSHIRDKYTKFADVTREAQQEKSPMLACIGSQWDELVSIRSAHASDPGAEHYFVHPATPHNMLVVSGQAVHLAGRIVDSMLGTTRIPETRELQSAPSLQISA